MYLDQDLVRLNIWDTAGQERYHALGPIYYRSAQGALLVYDVTNPESLIKVKEWARELNKTEGIDRIKLCIIGNKIDLLQAQQQQLASSATNQLNKLNQQKSTSLPIQYSHPVIQDAIKFTNEIINARHYLTSAKQNLGLGELFISLSKRMVDQHKKRRNCNQDLVETRTNVARTLSLAEDVDEDESRRRAGQWPPPGMIVPLNRPNDRQNKKNGIKPACQC